MTCPERILPPSADPPIQPPPVRTAMVSLAFLVLMLTSPLTDLRSQEPAGLPPLPEPTYQGLTGTQWAAALKSKDPNRRRSALYALHNLPPQSDETLQEILQCLRSEDQQLQHSALLALEPYGPRAKPTLPDLLQILAGPGYTMETPVSAMKTLGAMGTEAADAIPVLLRRLHSPTLISLDTQCAVALCRIGTPEAVRAVLEELEYAEAKREDFHYCIDALGYAGERGVGPLIRLLADLPAKPHMYSDRCLLALLQALARIGPPARAAVPWVEKYVRPKDFREVGIWARLTILKVAPDRLNDEQTIPELLNQLGQRSSGFDPAEAMLVAYGRKAVPAIVKALAGAPQNDALITVLKQMQGQARAAIPAVLAIAREKGHKARRLALESLGPMGLPNEEWVPVLAEALSATAVRQRAAMALRSLGVAAAPALPELQKYRSDPEVKLAIEMIQRNLEDAPVLPPQAPVDF